LSAKFAQDSNFFVLAIYCGSKVVYSGNGRSLIAPRRLLLLLVSMPLRIVNRCCLAFPVTLQRVIRSTSCMYGHYALPSDIRRFDAYDKRL